MEAVFLHQDQSSGLTAMDIAAIERNSTNDFDCGSISSKEVRHRAVEHMLNGGVITGANLGVGYMLINGWDDNAQREIARIKGDERSAMTMGVCLPAKEFARYIDLTRIHPDLTALFSNPRLLERCFGSGPFLRVPANNTAINPDTGMALPGVVLSNEDNPYIQNWIPKGNIPFSHLVYEMLHHGMIPAITSANKHGNPEIVVQTEVAAFSEANEIELFMYDENYVNDPRAELLPHGSFPILKVDRIGAHLVRSGRVQDDVVMRLVPSELIDLANSDRIPNYRNDVLPGLLLNYLKNKGAELNRLAVLMYTLGKTPEQIISRFDSIVNQS
ncbi:MAG: hypothetical protein ACEQSA_00525 [Weeksellaceae bacterium]